MFTDDKYLQILCWHLLVTIPQWISVHWIEHSLTYECPNHDSVNHINNPWINQIQHYSHLDCDEENKQYHDTQCHWPSWKWSFSNLTNNENITYEFIAYWTQRSILFCCTETNNILRAVLSSDDAVFSMRTFTWSWWLPVSLCRSVGRWAIWSTP